MSSKMMLMANSLTHVRPLTCAAAAAAAVYPSRLVAQPPDLIKWVKIEGGFVQKSIKIAQGDSFGLGLVASEDIPKGSDLIALPQHIPLKFDGSSSESENSHSALIKLAQHVPGVNWKLGAFDRGAVGYEIGFEASARESKERFVLVAIHQQSPRDLLSADFLSWRGYKELAVNKRCRFLLEFEKILKHELENLKPDDHPFSGQDVDSSALGWAMSAVSSRAFRLYGSKSPDGTRSNAPMMLPLIDMCNHSFDPNAEIVQEEANSDRNMLVKEIKQNDPLLLNYGCLSSDLFLLDYGFVIPSNPYDCIELKYDAALLDAASMAAGVSSPNFSSPSPWQQQILSHLNLDGPNSDLKVTLGGGELVEGRLLAALRVVLSNDEEAMKQHDLETLKSLTVEAPLGISTEVSALRTVVALCVIALGHFPTKIMEDESLLKQNVSPTTELALQFRIQKKSLIVDVMRDLSKRVKLLLAK
ncbi:hypothetical protein H5410_000107 [Solanum commersonii]|uniref:SET domain-containing protein n=1 Tax=Solanum commersonii TaxID=4109 RepID=A0A9J6AV30_SOLCO|nr:hypothetical protein H5410_000107 [Solanum commersonii]